MTEEIDWTLATWEGSRRQQHREFLALSLREKIQVLEDLGEVARVLAPRAEPPSPAADQP